MAPLKVIHASKYGDVVERSMNYDVEWNEWVKCMNKIPQVPRALCGCLGICEDASRAVKMPSSMESR